ncbi:MAG: hypothetical protein LBM93_01345 [Oscillospiraceae bacterium]|jgi:hypothetical protein|nr:hypothetical protein [Oscillospiraceae bacterium]
MDEKLNNISLFIPPDVYNRIKLFAMLKKAERLVSELENDIAASAKAIEFAKKEMDTTKELIERIRKEVFNSND